MTENRGSLIAFIIGALLAVMAVSFGEYELSHYCVTYDIQTETCTKMVDRDAMQTLLHINKASHFP